MPVDGSMAAVAKRRAVSSDLRIRSIIAVTNKSHYLASCALIVLLGQVVVGAASAANVVVLGLFNESAVLRVDGKLRKLAIGQTTPEGIRLLDANSEYAVLEQDGSRRHYPVGRSVPASYSVAKRRTTPTTLHTEIAPIDGFYRSAGRINGKDVNFIVDTGATWVSLNSAEAARLGIDYRAQGQRRRVETAMGYTDAYLVSLERVAVGGVELENVEAAVLEGTSPSEVLLGMSFLKRVNLQSSGRALLLQHRP